MIGQCQLCSLLNNPEVADLSESMRLTSAFMSGWVACKVAAKMGQATLCDFHTESMKLAVDQAQISSLTIKHNRQERRASLRLIKQ